MTNHGTLDENILRCLRDSQFIFMEDSEIYVRQENSFCSIVQHHCGWRARVKKDFKLVLWRVHSRALACPNSIQFQFILFLNSLTQMKSADWKTDGFCMTPWFSLFPLPLDKPTRTLSFHIFPFCPRLRKIQQCHAGSAAPALKKDPHTATLGAPCRLQKDGDCFQPTDRPGFKRSKTALTIGLRKAGDVPGHKTIVFVLGLLSFACWQCLYMPVYYRDISSNSLLLYYLYYLRNPRTARHNTSNH